MKTDITARPSWRQQIVAGLAERLESYFDQNPVGVVRRRDSQLQIALHKPGAGVIPIFPDIVVEAFSPAVRLAVVHNSIRRHLSCGVREIWIIEVSSRGIEVWTSVNLPNSLEGSQALTSALLPGFSARVEDLFSL